MELKLLRKHIREAIAIVLNEAEEPKYFIRYSKGEGEFMLYKRFFGLDQYDNPNEQITVIRGLGRSPKQAERLAKQITGQDLEAKKPTKNAPLKKGEMIMPYSTYKGKRIKDIPIDYLVTFIQKNKWTNIINKDLHLKHIYQYLTQNIPAKTQKYFETQVKGTSTEELIEKYNEYTKYKRDFYKEAIAFANILIPIMQKELQERRVIQ